MYLLCVNGIATVSIARLALPLEWERWLKDRGVSAVVDDAHWDSTGDVIEDIASIMLSKAFREKQIEGLVEQIVEGVRRATSSSPDGYIHLAARRGASDGVIVLAGYSMGVVLGLEALERAYARKLLPDHVPVHFLGLGGPIGHPIWGPSLRTVGLGRSPPRLPAMCSMAHFWNEDDPVAALWRGKLGYRKQEGWNSVRVAIAPNDWACERAGMFPKEHADKFYITHPRVVSHLRGLVTS